jgi:AbrB family looped-hinge helix DNA binding protein
MATITAKRQLTIPAAVARKLNLQPGDKLSFTFENGTIFATPLNQEAYRQAELLREIKRRVRRGIGDDELIQLISEFVASGGVQPVATPLKGISLV